MKKRTIAGTLAATAAAVYLTRLGLKLAGELRRYDIIRTYSNEGPVLVETPEMLMQIMRQERQTVKDFIAFFKAVPKDVARYTKIEAM
jgi:hypothetical protein